MNPGFWNSRATIRSGVHEVSRPFRSAPGPLRVLPLWPADVLAGRPIACLGISPGVALHRDRQLFSQPECGTAAGGLGGANRAAAARNRVRNGLREHFILR